MLLFHRGHPKDELNDADLKAGLLSALVQLGNRHKVLLLPPDFSRFHSRAGELTAWAYAHYQDRVKDVLPATGTHFPMTPAEKTRMFPGIPLKLFRTHDWRKGFTTLGTIPARVIEQISDHAVSFDWPAQAANLVAAGGHDLILSVGQVVPHEVAGMANFNKNLFVGIGGAEAIHKSHFLGAAYGMERIMGRLNNPVRFLFNYASKNFAAHLPVVYILTVIGARENGTAVVRGLFIGDDEECFQRAAALSLKINLTILEQPLKKIVVYLDPSEYKSTWLGNKSIYRTRMAMADGGELIVLAPGLKQFGEDPMIDQLIRKYGYGGTTAVLNQVKDNSDLQQNLSAAAHLIHGSAEGRFRVIYCPGKITGSELHSVYFEYADLNTMEKKYPSARLQEGVNILPGGEEIFYISNPALGLWACRQNFRNRSRDNHYHPF